ncbi:hypothetical protein DAEQUDRAFT_661194 [Daedalea quercina L-15889]|uniref:DNA polymerase V n=1 Tax=Daedalea quercina L-15889 TaxID=1314783 RepID=A0A165TVF2_9APHY|nr:hypothetical protein DAEQUDRAFT_661194 [Daedalea quercina L-15889]
MSTTLPLFWDLSSASAKTRIDASVKLVSSLEHFQSQFVPKEDVGHEEDEEQTGDGLNALNAQDVSYSIRRLVRGLASPRESSRLGFAVALTELLSRINTVTCSQIIVLILDSSKTQGSMTGQEERDMLFARLFGFISVIQSGLLFREATLPSSSSLVSILENYTEVLAQLVALGEKKSWLRESAWWAIGLAIDALHGSDVSWKDNAVESSIGVVFAEKKAWTPEKIALALKLQGYLPSRDWQKLLSPTFKNPDLLSTGNLSAVARILRVSADDDEESDVPKSGAWKPQVHFVWDMLLDRVLSPAARKGSNTTSFPDFFRIVVDESLFSSTSSPERKYWGFQVFTKALPRVSGDDMPMLFTKNFMRSWINHLSNSDRYLHKAARQVVTDIQSYVKENPALGFTLILQLTGVNGSRQFDKLTRTKTVESILTSMDREGIQNYINYLLKQVTDDQTGEPVDAQAVNSRRTWIIDQLAALVRNGAIPKSDDWVQSILDWLAIHGLFTVTKKSEKSPISALRSVPAPQFSDELRKLCRDRLLSCLADLTGQAAVVEKDDKTVVKIPGAASDGRLWVDRVLATVEQLEKDTKHVAILTEVDEEDQALQEKARQLATRLKTVPEAQREAAKGAELLLSATLLYHYCAEEEADTDTLESCIDGAARMFPTETKKSKKSRKSTGADVDANAVDTLEPVDVLVDNVIGFLEQATAYMRAVANQVFSLLSGSVKESTISLILSQLERRDPAELMADEDEDLEDVEDGEDDEEGEEEETDEASEESEDEDEDEDNAEETDLELRKKIEEALRINGVEATTGDSDDESDEDLMDDDQMLAIDDQLAAVFRARATEKKPGKDVGAQREATHFKNRVLDLIEIFLKKQPSSHLTIRLILPLVDLVVGTGPDEKQLADKATGILRSRVGKAKELPSSIQRHLAAEVLTELHLRARKAPSADVLATLSACSIYVARALHHEGEDAPILQGYRESLIDFVTRKASRLNTQFFQDFVRRQISVAWALRDDLLEVSGKAVNVYRQCQAFLLLQSLIKELSQLVSMRADVLGFFPKLRVVLLDVISQACEASDASLTAAQVKELLKLALLAVRQTRHMCGDQALPTIWEPSLWNDLSSKLAASSRFKSSTGLRLSCKEIAHVSSQLAKSSGYSTTKKAGTGDSVAASKRKAGVLGEDTSGPQKVKHKKVKKIKAS